MKRVAWLTDLHLNFVEPPAIRAFLASVAAENFDTALIGGDISDSPRLIAYLQIIENILKRPVYFVLGNHDYYHDSMERVQRMVTLLAAQSDCLTYLPAAGVVELTPETALVGHGGWADGRIGDYHNSWVMMNDYVLIEELARISKAERLAQLHALGDEAGAYLRETLPRAFEHHRRVILLTHVPPFREACWHEGRISDADFLPHFTCKASGDALLDVMAAQPDDNELLVLCGHTHGEGEAQLLPNLRVLTGGAAYGEPRVQRVLEVK